MPSATGGLFRCKTGGRFGAMVCVCLAAAGGCGFAPQYTRLKPAASERHREAGDWKPAGPDDRRIRGDWWRAFKDADLDALEVRASVGNRTIAAAFSNFLAARALVSQARSDASWEVDLEGRVADAVKAGGLETQAGLGDLGAVQLRVYAEVAEDYFEIKNLDSTTRILRGEVRVDRELLKLTRIQGENGIAPGQSILLAETQLDIARAQAAGLGIQRALLEHAVATLLGPPASNFSIGMTVRSSNPIEVPLGLPSGLLERRPDIAAAERRVQEANARIGAARAAYFPALTLDGSVGFLMSSTGGLMSAPVLAWSLGATATQTIFDGGKSFAVTDQAWASYRGFVADYRQTVLTAFQEVEDKLATLRILKLELAAEDAATASSAEFLALAVGRYRAGLDTCREVTSAQTAHLANQRTVLGLRMKKMSASVELIKALGGGWVVKNEVDFSGLKASSEGPFKE